MGDLDTIFGYDNFNTIEFGMSIFDQLMIREKKKPILIVCIGSDKCIADSLGPLVGTMLLKECRFVKADIEVVGTLNKTCNATNIEEMITPDMKDRYYIIAVDACTGCKENIGNTYLTNGPAKPGKGVGKDLSPVGDISIATIICEYGKVFNSENKLYDTYKYAEKITESLVLAIDNYRGTNV